MRVISRVQVRLCCVFILLSAFCMVSNNFSVKAAKIINVTETNETVGIKNGSADASKSNHRHGPTVMGQSNQINLRYLDGPSIYVGSLYIGSENVVSKIIFDTRTKWTGVILDTAANAENASPYSLDASETRIMYKPNGGPERITLR